ncbi:MAG: DUF2141 domain-containing protein [Bacteroidota bacterium]
MTRLLLFLLLPLWSNLPTTSVSINLVSTASAKGCVRVAIFSAPEDYQTGKSMSGWVTKLTGEPYPAQIGIPALPPGKYVIAAFHDLNENEKLDRNLFGVPVEPYGFVRTPQNKWRKPRWDEISFEVTDQTKAISVEMKRWKEY